MSTTPGGEKGLTGALRAMEAATTTALPEDLPKVVAELERLRAVAWMRLAVPQTVEPDADRLLEAGEAAAMLGIDVAALYRQKWPFRVAVSKARTRYSLQGIQRFIRTREGR